MRNHVFVLLLLLGSTSFGQSYLPDDMDLPMSPPPSPIGSNSVTTPPITPDPEEDEPRDTPPPVIYGEEIDSANDTIFYVIDRSGSMNSGIRGYITWDGNSAAGSRMDRAKAELQRSILGLSENFQFNIIAYDCGLAMWSHGMREASDNNKQEACSWVRFLTPGGGTGTGPATALALDDKENMAVVLLTDGSPNCGATGMGGHRAMIRNANTQGAVVNVFGIAAVGSCRTFCQGVAFDNGGSYTDVP